MRPIKEVADQVLRWTQPSSFKREFELRAGEDVLATLRWQKTFGSLALAESPGGAWTFKRSGFLTPTVSVRAQGSESTVAVLKPGWRGEGTLQFSDGRRYQWVIAGFWRPQWTFAGEGGGPLIHFKYDLAFLQQTMEVEIEPGAGSLKDLPLLATLGWYLIVLMSEGGGGAAAAGGGP